MTRVARIDRAIGRAKLILALLERARRDVRAATAQEDVDKAFVETLELKGDILGGARQAGLRSPLHG